MSSFSFEHNGKRYRGSAVLERDGSITVQNIDCVFDARDRWGVPQRRARSVYHSGKQAATPHQRKLRLLAVKAISKEA